MTLSGIKDGSLTAVSASLNSLTFFVLQTKRGDPRFKISKLVLQQFGILNLRR